MATREELLLCIDREIRMRERVYPRWVDAGRMTAARAAQEIAWMKEVHGLLERHLPPTPPVQGALPL